MQAAVRKERGKGEKKKEKKKKEEEEKEKADEQMIEAIEHGVLSFFPCRLVSFV